MPPKEEPINVKHRLGEGLFRSKAWAAKQVLGPLMPLVLHRYSTVGIYQEKLLVQAIIVDRSQLIGLPQHSGAYRYNMK